MVMMSQFIKAQTVNSGAWMLGGSVGFNSIKYEDDDDDNTVFNFSPNVGYYVINDLGIGVRLNYYNESIGGESESVFGFGPWARYYIANSSIFAQAGIDFGPAQFDLYSLFSDESSSNLHFGLGYSWFLNNSVAIEPLLQYNIFNENEDNFESDYNRFVFNIGVQAFLGRN